MSLFKLSNTGSFRRFARGVFALLVLPASFLVMGCDSNGGGSGDIWITGSWSRLDGTFEADAGDSFTFDTAAQTFKRGGFGSWDGTIPGILHFDRDGNAGLVFVRFGENGPVNWVQEGGEWVTVPVEGNYTAIAFRAAPEGFQLAEGFDGDGMPTTNTLAEARRRFTVDTVDGYVSWGNVPVYAMVE